MLLILQETENKNDWEIHHTKLSSMRCHLQSIVEGNVTELQGMTCGQTETQSLWRT